MQKKTVAILLAVYRPRQDWLIELLDSLNRQTYPALTLYVRDDASEDGSTEGLGELLRTHITAFPFVLNRNDRNLGSNGTFEALIRDCREDCVAFCDQDDVWLPCRVENSVRLLEESPLRPVLVCSEVSVIDGNGKQIADTMNRHRRRHVFLRGEGLAPELIHRNFAMGCTMLLPRERALSYLPFPQSVVHDHYLAFRAALDGAIDYLPEPQILYRVYGGNQTGVMSGVRTKEDYLQKRILVFADRVACFSAVSDLPELKTAREWADARLSCYRRERGARRRLRKLGKINPTTTLFERYAWIMPGPLFRLAIRLTQKRIL